MLFFSDVQSFLFQAAIGTLKSKTVLDAMWYVSKILSSEHDDMHFLMSKRHLVQQGFDVKSLKNSPFSHFTFSDLMAILTTVSATVEYRYWWLSYSTANVSASRQHISYMDFCMIPSSSRKITTNVAVFGWTSSKSSNIMTSVSAWMSLSFVKPWTWIELLYRASMQVSELSRRSPNLELRARQITDTMCASRYLYCLWDKQRSNRHSAAMISSLDIASLCPTSNCHLMIFFLWSLEIPAGDSVSM